MTTEIGSARPDDVPHVLHLLEENQLPLEGLSEHLETIVVARRGGKIVGRAALEAYADEALLRSVAVAPDRRGAGLDRELTDVAIQMARDRGLLALFLLTTTADRYFPKFGV